MDKYAQLINDLQICLDETKKEIKQLEEENRDLRVDKSKLKSRIYIAQNSIKTLKLNLDYINSADSRYLKFMKKSLMVVFLISVIVNMLINNFLGLAVLNMVIDSLVSSSLFTLVVGFAEKYIIEIKKDFLNKYNRVECEQGINQARTNIKELEKELEQISVNLSENKEKLLEKTNLERKLQKNLTEYKTKRNAILDELLGRIVDKEIDVNPTLDVPSFQLVMKKIKDSK